MITSTQYSNTQIHSGQSKFIWLALSALLFTLCSSVEAQKPPAGAQGLGTAKQIGVTILPNVLARADKVIK